MLAFAAARRATARRLARPDAAPDAGVAPCNPRPGPPGRCTRPAALAVPEISLLATARRRAPHTPAAHVPLVSGPPGVPTVTLVLPTRPGPAMRASDRRRLAHQVQGVSRRLQRRGADRPTRHEIVRRVGDVASAARQITIGDGIAIVASAEDAALVHLRHPVRPRVLVGPPPNRLDIVGAALVPDRVAVVGLAEGRARLLTCEFGVVREVLTARLPLRLDARTILLPDLLSASVTAVAHALPPATPLVVAGDERTALAFADRFPDPARIAGVLPGDHRYSSPLALCTVARRQLDRALSIAQRRAIAEVLVAAEDGRLHAGKDSVRDGVEATSNALLVVERGLGEGRGDLARRVVDQGGREVVVPDGRLTAFGRIALVAPHDGDVP